MLLTQGLRVSRRIEPRTVCSHGTKMMSRVKQVNRQQVNRLEQRTEHQPGCHQAETGEGRVPDDLAPAVGSVAAEEKAQDAAAVERRQRQQIEREQDQVEA